MRLDPSVDPMEDTETDGSLLEALATELSEEERIIAGLRGLMIGSEDYVAHLLVATPARVLFVERYCPGPRLAYLPARTTASSVPLRAVLNVSMQTYLEGHQVAVSVQGAGSGPEAVLHASLNANKDGEFILKVARFVGAVDALVRMANGWSGGSAPPA